jgi:excisionase family DNA binding protein
MEEPMKAYESEMEQIPSNPDGQRMLTLLEMALYLRVSKKTLYYWVNRREIPFIKVGRHLRFDATEVLVFFREKTFGSPRTCPFPAILVEAPPRSLKTRGGLADRKEVSNGYN